MGLINEYVIQQIIVDKRIVAEQILELVSGSTTSLAASLLREEEKFLKKHVKVITKKYSPRKNKKVN
jgi:hypothetical protein